jgi:hypothetical protein
MTREPLGMENTRSNQFIWVSHDISHNLFYIHLHKNTYGIKLISSVRSEVITVASMKMPAF